MTVITGGAALCEAAERWNCVPRVIVGRRKIASTDKSATLDAPGGPAESGVLTGTPDAGKPAQAD